MFLSHFYHNKKYMPKKPNFDIVDPYDRPRAKYSSPGPRNSGSNLLSVIAIILIILAAIGVIGYFIYQNQAAKEELALVEDSVAEQATTTPETPVDPAADWEAYNFTVKGATATSTNKTLFSFRHPSGLTVERNGDVLRIFSTAATDTQMFIYYEATTSTLDNYLNDLDKASAKAWEGKPSIKVVTSTPGTLGGQPLVIRQQKLLAADLEAYAAYIFSGNKVYTVSLAAPALNQQLAQFFVVFLNNFKLE